jgi:hypothetical protein
VACQPVFLLLWCRGNWRVHIALAFACSQCPVVNPDFVDASLEILTGVVPVVPSPKSQVQAVMLPVEESVKTTVRGAVPAVEVALKLATETAAGNVILISFEKILSLLWLTS